MHPDKEQIATGQVGKSPQILVWNSNTLNTTSIMKGEHTEGVGILVFDKNGEVNLFFYLTASKIREIDKRIYLQRFLCPVNVTCTV